MAHRRFRGAPHAVSPRHHLGLAVLVQLLPQLPHRPLSRRGVGDFLLRQPRAPQRLGESLFEQIGRSAFQRLRVDALEQPERVLRRLRVVLREKTQARPQPRGQRHLAARPDVAPVIQRSQPVAAVFAAPQPPALHGAGQEQRADGARARLGPTRLGLIHLLAEQIIVIDERDGCVVRDVHVLRVPVAGAEQKVEHRGLRHLVRRDALQNSRTLLRPRTQRAQRDAARGGREDARLVHRHGVGVDGPRI